MASGVRLFADASKRADASFSLSADDLEPLSQILELVGGMPLGIELAAAWVDVMQIQEIANEISKSLDFLDSELEGIPERHRSVRAVFDYSWSMLGEGEGRIFSALSVFRGGFTREAGEAVAGASMRNLANLVSKSLLVHNRESGRYTVHELLRQYAEESLREDTLLYETTVAAHKDFYADLAADAEELILRDQIQLIRVVEGDLDNIRLAWRRHPYASSTVAAAVLVGVVALYFANYQAGTSETVNWYDVFARVMTSRLKGMPPALEDLSRLAQLLPDDASRNAFLENPTSPEFLDKISGQLASMTRAPLGTENPDRTATILPFSMMITPRVMTFPETV